MMRKREKTANHEHQNIDTLIGARAIFTGELSFEGALRIDGQFEGNIHSNKGGILIVSEGAKITGEVNVPCLILHGTITGNVRTNESLKVGPTGCLHGDLEYQVMSLSEGSSINGRCSRINEQSESKSFAIDTPQPTKSQVASPEHLQEV